MPDNSYDTPRLLDIVSISSCTVYNYDSATYEWIEKSFSSSEKEDYGLDEFDQDE